ncbi:MAG: aconitase X swivel domain-containing protein [Nitrososphaerales archaeon]
MNADTGVLHGRALVGGAAAGEVLVARAPLSFWGGYDYNTGEIIDRRHPLAGQIAAGRVLALPFTIGSSTTTAVLLEAVRAGTAPAAILAGSTDAFLALAAIVAGELYGKPLPVIALDAEAFAALADGQWAEVTPAGEVLLRLVPAV